MAVHPKVMKKFHSNINFKVALEEKSGDLSPIDLHLMEILELTFVKYFVGFVSVFPEGSGVRGRG